MSDGPGRLFVTSGNGVSPPRGPGASPPPHLGDSVIRLTVRRDGSLQAGDFFSPADAARLEKNDLDLGSSLPLGLPFGTHRYPHLIMQASKDGRVFLLNRDDLGGRAQGPDGTDKVVSAGPLIRGKFKIPVVFGIPAVFGGTPIVTRADAGHDYVYFVSGRMHALHFEISGSGVPTLVDQARSTTVFGYSSGSPLVTSNGAHPGSAVVWDVYSSDGAGDNGRLEAFDAMPQTRCSPAVRGACLKMIWSAPIGFAVKFAPPATDGGRVFIGSRDGHVLGFGIVHPARHQAASR